MVASGTMNEVLEIVLIAEDRLVDEITDCRCAIEVVGRGIEEVLSVVTNPTGRIAVCAFTVEAIARLLD